MRKLVVAFGLLLANIGFANNIQVTNVSTVPANNTIRFTISWDNGWRSSVLNNWDAAWVFLRFYHPQYLEWQPLYFTNTGNVIPSGFTATMGPTSGSNVGVFLFRSASGSGTTTITDIELGIPSQQATGTYDIKVFAVEMVYVPTASFYLGDGASGTGRYDGIGFGSTVPAFNQGNPGSIHDPLCDYCILSLSIMISTYPNGYNAFYCMKYELSQGAYRDFLNSLTYNQQISRTGVAPTSATGTAALNSANRNYLEIKTPGVATATPAVYGCDANNNNIWDESSDGEWVACNYLTWADQAAWLAWAGLRPLTELEFEKAGRGIQIPVAGEYAWGNGNIATTRYILTNPTQASETVSNPAISPIGNANYLTTFPNNPLDGPLRNGIFATATSNRVSSGGSFYGIMELSGNLLERVVTTATMQGGGFGGVHGNGLLTSAGHAAVSTWPGLNGSVIDGTANATGLILRGGNWVDPSTTLRISNRSLSLLVTDPNNVRQSIYGIRGARTAP